MESKKSNYTADQIIRGACPPNEPDGLLPIPSYYSGRGPLRGDLDTHHLEKIHAFIKNNIGEKESKTFTRFVHRLEDLSATAFLEGFIRLADGGFKKATPKKGILIQGHGDKSHQEAKAYVLGALAASCENQIGKRESQKIMSKMIKSSFIFTHANDLPKKQKTQEYISPY